VKAVSAAMPTPVPAAPAAPTPAPRDGAAAAPLSLHVDRLVLHGLSFARHDTARIERAFEHEVQRLAAASEARLAGIAPQALDRLRLSDLRLDADATPEQLGRRLAAALLREIAP
jgi:hypothetical protein